MARFKRRARRSFSRARRGYRRHKAGIGGIGGLVMRGAGVEIASNFITPMVSSYIPPVMGMSAKTEVLLGGGIVAKLVLHKGGSWADTMIILGSARAASELLGSVSGSTTGGMQYL